MYITDPRNADKKIVKNDETFKKYTEKHGYIYDEKENSFSIPSQKSAEALNSGMKCYELKIVNKDDPLVQMNQLDTRVNFLLNIALKKQKGIKFNLGFKIKFIKTVDGVETKDSSTISEKCVTVTHKSEIKEALKLQKESLLRQIDRFTNGGSGLRIHRITRNFINIYKYKPLRARGFIKLPDKINNKKATINIQNKDDKCFIYCLGRRFDPNPESKNLERVSKHLKKTCCDLGFDKIKIPVTVKDIPKIEKEYNIAINLFGHNDGEIFPILTNKKVVDENKHIDLLITSREDEHHYVWIKNFNKLFSQQTKHHGKKYFCKNCIQCFSSVEVLEKHNPNCIVLNGTQKIELPKEGSNLEFKSLNKTITVPFVIYADLEALLKPLKKCENIKNDNESYTIKTHEHKTCSYGHKVVCYEDDKYSKPYRMFRGKDAIYNFFEALFEEEKQIDDYMKEFYKSKMFLTQDDWKIYNQAKCCYVCKESFTGENYKVRDHCHITNKFRGPACNTCNLQMKLTHTIPVIFHNLRGYDMHLLLQEVGRFKRELTIIPNNMEKYMSFSVGTVKKCYNYKTKKYEDKLRFDLRFIDSFQFMSSSLSNLVNDLKQGGMDKFKYMNREFGEFAELLTRKGIYPYSYMNKWSKFDVPTKKLENKHFRNDLTGDEISDKDFMFYKKVCKKLKIKN